jgi:heterogeneous nuclear ribonucleoprotein A1/A3
MVNDDSTTVNQAMAEPYTAGDWEKTTEVEEENGEEDIHKLLEPFTRGELADHLLADACLRDPALLARIVDSAATTATHRRLFVHGLNPSRHLHHIGRRFCPLWHAQ